MFATERSASKPFAGAVLGFVARTFTLEQARKRVAFTVQMPVGSRMYPVPLADAAPAKPPRSPDTAARGIPIDILAFWSA